MKKHNTKNPVIYKTDDGITIRLDSKHSKAIEKKAHQECVALWEGKMGYGIWFTQDHTVAVYAKDSAHKNVLSHFWDCVEEISDGAIEKALEDAASMNDVIDIAASILLACSKILIDAGIESIDEIAA